MSALLTDFQAKGLLRQTLVALTTEFGCTPLINDNDGRDHDDVVVCLLAAAVINEEQPSGRWMKWVGAETMRGLGHPQVSVPRTTPSVESVRWRYWRA